MSHVRMLLWTASLSLMTGVIGATDQSATYDTKKQAVTNWRTEAIAHLNVTDDRLLKHKTLRCVRLNNYWCLKDIGWQGGIGSDADNHTAFLNGQFAARAAVRNFRTAYIRHGRKSALQIMSAYAPADDCVGSKAGRLPDCTCKWGFNPTEKYARSVATGITEDPGADLVLFDALGNANVPVLVRFLQNMPAFETGGLTVRVETIERGICMEVAGCSQ